MCSKWELLRQASSWKPLLKHNERPSLASFNKVLDTTDDDVIYCRSTPRPGSSSKDPLLIDDDMYFITIDSSDDEDQSDSDTFLAEENDVELDSSDGEDRLESDPPLAEESGIEPGAPEIHDLSLIQLDRTPLHSVDGLLHGSILQGLKEVYGDDLPEADTMAIADLNSGSTYDRFISLGSLPSAAKKRKLNLDPSPNFDQDFSIGNLLQRSTKKQKAEGFSIGLIDRKRFFFLEPSINRYEVSRAFERCLENLWNEVGWHNVEGAEWNKCWHHPKPTYPGKIHTKLAVRDHGGRLYALSLHVGVVPLFMRKRLTPEMINGYVYKSWHLSHLCGNWTCCNPMHHTIESGTINQSRKKCHNGSIVLCPHKPRCLTYLREDMPQKLRSQLKLKSSMKKRHSSPPNSQQIYEMDENTGDAEEGYDD